MSELSLRERYAGDVKWLLSFYVVGALCLACDILVLALSGHGGATTTPRRAAGWSILSMAGQSSSVLVSGSKSPSLSRLAAG
ncbi:MAG: hypothetical protein ACLQK4_08740 [Acidimicrobiales bacterium]